MATTMEPVQEPVGAPEEEDTSTRRLLLFILIFLGVAALALLGLLLWLLRPEPAAPPPGQAAGYPIEVVTTIYGYGNGPNELLRAPLGVAFDPDGNVWISNTGLARVDVFTNDGDYVRSVGREKGAGKLAAPYGMVADPATDQVYVADYGAHMVQIYSTSGQYVGHFPADDQELKVFGSGGFSPYDVQVVEGRIVVASNDGLYFFDGNGHVIARWGYTSKNKNVRGVDVGMFNFPDSFVADPESGRFYVADTLNRRIVALGAEGRWLWVSGTPDASGDITGFWQLPRGIERGADGNLYVVDTFRFDEEGMGTGHIVVLSPEGKLLSEFGRAGTEDGAFNFPEQLAAGPDGLWAIADRANNRVVIFRLRTPYPEVSDLLADRYPKGYSVPEDVWATPTPAPTG